MAVPLLHHPSLFCKFYIIFIAFHSLIFLCQPLFAYLCVCLSFSLCIVLAVHISAPPSFFLFFLCYIPPLYINSSLDQSCQPSIYISSPSFLEFVDLFLYQFTCCSHCHALSVYPLFFSPHFALFPLTFSACLSTLVSAHVSAPQLQTSWQQSLSIRD